MNDYRIRQHYAKALFLLASDLGQTDRVMEDMICVEKVCHENHMLVKVMGNPTIRMDRKVAVIDEIFAPHLSPTTMAFLHFVVRRKRAVNLRGIAMAYMQRYNDENGIVVTRVCTAAEMNGQLTDRIRRGVERFTGRTAQMEYTTDDKMLGGFQLMFDTYLVDARLQTRIDKLRRVFSRNDYESKL